MAPVRKRKADQGMALIELTLVLMLLVMLTFGVMEYGWMFYKIQQVTNAARAGARNAVLPDSSNSDVQQTVNAMMTAWGMGGAGYSLTISEADIAAVESGQIVTVTVQVPYDAVKLLGMSIFPTPASLRASASMAKEGP